jgi:tRNA pseudouridine55 synthase
MGRKRKGIPLHGWIVLDKPLGLSSARAVAAVRRVTGAAKAGHGGTLDPLASGILPIALGEATKTVAWAMGGQKTYRFRLRWGVARSTEDAEGEVTATSEVRPDEAAIGEALPRFMGTLLQRPPAFSAIKVGGRRSYDLARADAAVELAAREVEVHALRLVSLVDADHADFEARVGKGTYIRSLGRDLALALGTVGHLAALRRTAVGPFGENLMISLDKLEALGHIAAASEHLLPIETALDDIPALALTEAEADRLRHGLRVALPQGPSSPIEHLQHGALVCATASGKLVALAEIEAGTLRPVRVMNFSQ